MPHEAPTGHDGSGGGHHVADHVFLAGDLRVDLIAPDGTAVALHGNTGGSANDLVKTYSAQETPALRPLLGRSITGSWQLQVQDTFLLDVGRFNSWRIAARVAATAPGPTGPRLDGRERSKREASYASRA
jgi:subtilisin-like proprotein convertase family protein